MRAGRTGLGPIRWGGACPARRAEGLVERARAETARPPRLGAEAGGASASPSTSGRYKAAAGLAVTI